jgi:hypothetical protein
MSAFPFLQRIKLKIGIEHKTKNAFQFMTTRKAERQKVNTLSRQLSLSLNRIMAFIKNKTEQNNTR